MLKLMQITSVSGSTWRFKSVTFLGLYPSFCGNKQKTVNEYVQGRGNIKLIPAAISITVSFTSSILILGYPAEVSATLTLTFKLTFFDKNVNFQIVMLTLSCLSNHIVSIGTGTLTGKTGSRQRRLGVFPCK